jgi:hypothetical protein
MGPGLPKRRRRMFILLLFCLALGKGLVHFLVFPQALAQALYQKFSLPELAAGFFDLGSDIEEQLVAPVGGVNFKGFKSSAPGVVVLAI